MRLFGLVFPILMGLVLCGGVYANTSLDNTNEVTVRQEMNDFPFEVEWNDKKECTVTVEVKFDAEVGLWKVAKIAGEGTMTLSASAESCREAVNDIYDGLSAMVFK
ncbi:MAG: hypothetical protein AAFO07_10110 [Bacteroidota bacterium]